MRWETQDPIPQLIVSDGDSLWTYDKDLEQVTRDPVSVLADSPAALLLNLNDQHLAQQYFVEELKRAGDKVVYQLTPNDDSLYQALVLEFLGDLPLSVGVIDTLDQQTRITLRNVRLNQPVTAVFEFTPPTGVDLLDNREP
jgi:outer membrane lipoprotein carrier protein